MSEVPLYGKTHRRVPLTPLGFRGVEFRVSGFGVRGHRLVPLNAVAPRVARRLASEFAPLPFARRAVVRSAARLQACRQRRAVHEKKSPRRAVHENIFPKWVSDSQFRCRPASRDFEKHVSFRACPYSIGSSCSTPRVLVITLGNALPASPHGERSMRITHGERFMISTFRSESGS